MTYAEEEASMLEWLEQEPDPTWPVEAECAHHGHEYHGDDHPDAPTGWAGVATADTGGTRLAGRLR